MGYLKINFYKKLIIITSFFGLLVGQSFSKNNIVLASDIISNNLPNYLLESSISSAIEATKINKWKSNIILREHDLSKVLKEQMKAEMIEDTVKRPITLGQLLNANYIVTLDMKQDFSGRNLYLKLIDIESGAILKNINEYHEFYEEDKKYPNYKSQRFQLRLDLMTKKLFNSTFYKDNQDSKPLDLGRQCFGITKKGQRCKIKEPYRLINEKGYCTFHD